MTFLLIQVGWTDSCTIQAMLGDSTWQGPAGSFWDLRVDSGQVSAKPDALSFIGFISFLYITWEMVGREGFWWEGFWWCYQQMSISPVRLSDRALQSFGVWPHPTGCAVVLLSLPFFSFRILEELINKMLLYDQEDFYSGKTDLFCKLAVFPPQSFFFATSGWWRWQANIYSYQRLSRDRKVSLS